MAEENENFEGVEEVGGGAPAEVDRSDTGHQAVSSGQSPAPASTDDWKGPSRQEWETLVRFANYSYGRLNEAGLWEDPEPEYDPNDEEAQAQAYLDQFVSGHPAVIAAAEMQGRQEMQKLFTSFEKDHKLDFDHDLAEQMADNIIGKNPGADPVQVLAYAAQQAHQVRAREREEGVKQYTKKLSGPARGAVGDLDGSSGRPEVKKGATYDDVIRAYGGEEV